MGVFSNKPIFQPAIAGIISLVTATITGALILASGSSITGHLIPTTDNTYDVGVSTSTWRNVNATGTAIFGGAVKIYNGLGPGSDNVQIGYDQSSAKVVGDTYLSRSPLNIYASSTGFQDTFTITAGGNGADGACFSAKNLGAILGRQCQTSSAYAYWIMSGGGDANGLAFQAGNTTPFARTYVDLGIRSGNVGIGTGISVIPNTKLEVVGTVSSTGMISGQGSAAAPGFTFNADTDNGLFLVSANNVGVSAGGVLQTQTDTNGVTLGASYAAITGREGIGYYFGDAVRGLRFAPSLNAGDFEFQNWRYNAFYFTRFDGATRTAVMTVSASSSKVCVGCTRGDLLDSSIYTKFNVVGTASTTGLAVGGSGATITAVLTNTASLDYGDMGAGTFFQDLTITVTGAADGDACQRGVPNALGSRTDEEFTCFVSSANTVTIRRSCLNVAGCGNPSAATVRAYVTKF